MNLGSKQNQVPDFQPPGTSSEPSRVSKERLGIAIVLVSILMAFVMYLHRLTLGEIVKYDSFQTALGATRPELGRVLGAFFLTYALFQIPAGWMSDRYGGRKMLTLCIISWSVLTGLTGLVSSVAALLVVRLACGIAQAGAYPTSSAIVRQWIPLESRGFASGLISMGGRIGGASAAILTAWLVWQTQSWRISLLVLALLGLVTSLIYWLVVRDKPLSGKPTPVDLNARIVTEESNKQPLAKADLLAVLWQCCRSRSLWLAAFVQFAVNIGWVFLATWLPSYLTQVKQVDPLQGARMVTLVLACGIPAQLLGGILSDFSVRRLGLRWGRVLPVTIATSIACCAYLSCIGLDSVLGIVICCGIVSAMTDLANPSFWAFTQDVGGKNTATVLGWCNMWGNLGASLSAMAFPYLIQFGEERGLGTAPIFVLFAAAFCACACAALGMNATRPISLSAT